MRDMVEGSLVSGYCCGMMVVRAKRLPSSPSVSMEPAMMRMSRMRSLPYGGAISNDRGPGLVSIDEEGPGLVMFDSSRACVVVGVVLSVSGSAASSSACADVADLPD
jgi:hypothetical protein